MGEGLFQSQRGRHASGLLTCPRALVWVGLVLRPQELDKFVVPLFTGFTFLALNDDALSVFDKGVDVHGTNLSSMDGPPFMPVSAHAMRRMAPRIAAATRASQMVWRITFHNSLMMSFIVVVVTG